jgi:hypothetical protein
MNLDLNWKFGLNLVWKIKKEKKNRNEKEKRNHLVGPISLPAARQLARASLSITTARLTQPRALTRTAMWGPPVSPTPSLPRVANHCHVGPLAIRSSSPSPTASPLPTRAGGGTTPRSSGRSGSVARLLLLRSTEAQRDPPQWSESCGWELTPRPELPDLRGEHPPARTLP